jgi:hypothetical protein
MAGGGIYIPIISEFNDKGTKEAVKSLKSLAKSQFGVAVSTTALIDLARRSVQAYNQDQAAQKQLALALTNTTGATQIQNDAVEKNVAALESQYHVADDLLRPSLGNLVRITGDLTLSQNLLKTALNVSAATGRDLESVSLAIGKAYQGNFKALKSMGIALSDSTLKSKDFSAAMAEVDAQTQGAAQTLADSAQGSWNALSIAVGNLGEALGQQLSPTLGSVAQGLADLTVSITDNTDQSEKNLGIVQLLKDGYNALKDPIGYLNGEYLNFAEATDTLTQASAGLFRMYEQSGNKAFTYYQAQHAKVEDKTKKTTKATDDAKKKLAELAKTAREKAAAELERLTGVYDGLISKADDYRMSVADQITGFVSLADAVQTAEQSDTAYNDALVERKNAYEELTAIQDERKRRGFDIGDPNITYDANDYADALDRVSKAEQGVTDAQSKRVDYTSEFRTQINAAKEFAGNLQALAAGDPPLGAMGIAQLLNLGPVAGNQVAKDLLSGVAGLTVSDINSTLASLSTASNLAGLQAASNDFGSQIQTAGRNIQGTGNTPAPNIYVTVQQTDPRAVVDALRDWNWTNGGIPISIGTLF